MRSKKCFDSSRNGTPPERTRRELFFRIAGREPVPSSVPIICDMIRWANAENQYSPYDESASQFHSYGCTLDSQSAALTREQGKPLVEWLCRQPGPDEIGPLTLGPTEWEGQLAKHVRKYLPLR